MLAIFMASAKD